MVAVSSKEYFNYKRKIPSLPTHPNAETKSISVQVHSEDFSLQNGVSGILEWPWNQRPKNWTEINSEVVCYLLSLLYICSFSFSCGTRGLHLDIMVLCFNYCLFNTSMAVLIREVLGMKPINRQLHTGCWLIRVIFLFQRVVSTCFGLEAGLLVIFTVEVQLAGS